MTIIHKLSIDLTQQVSPALIDAVQDDCGRALALALHTNGIPWQIPRGISAIVRYRKSDGIGGEYDTLPDGTCAWSAADNILTVALAPQVLTVAGETSLSVALTDGQNTISTFDILLQVQPGLHRCITKSDKYVNVFFDSGSALRAIGEKIIAARSRPLYCWVTPLLTVSAVPTTTAAILKVLPPIQRATAGQMLLKYLWKPVTGFPCETWACTAQPCLPRQSVLWNF